MSNGQFNAIRVVPDWAMCTDAVGGAHDGQTTIVLSFRAQVPVDEDEPLTEVLHQTFENCTGTLPPFSMRLQGAIELRRMLDIAIDRGIHERRLIEEGS